MAPGRGRADRHRPDVLPGARARPARGGAVMSAGETGTPVTTEEHGTSRGAMSTATPVRAPEETTPGAPEAPAEHGRVGAGAFDPKQLWKSLPDACRKLDPRVMVTSP